MGSVSAVGFIGRVIAAAGAVVMGASIFLDIAESGGISYLDIFRRMDIVILVVAGAAVVLLLLSFVAVDVEVACLFGVGLIGAYGFGFFSDFFIEQTFDKGIGTWLGNAGSLGVVLGAGIALLPAMLGRSRPRREPMFVQADTGPAEAPVPATPAPAQAPAPAQPAAPAAPTVAAGWYPDPSGQARLRYWNGENWTEQTQQ